MLTTLVPGILYALVTVVLLLWYPLSRKTVEQNSDILNRRHAAEMAAPLAQNQE